ncbi:hypothetical protein GLYMA_01G053400v4 [Glycine max]|uniref:Serine-threonine/tyrosine-protein kinase catalytic domain-containing protein n=1 Tax=Glycine max TaxID=3847 RepID=A0A0R0L749_SOYBN|nr:hypothetical protein GYH30_000558 [Glycine max]KRH74945.1 hypothetical protein GLYMA_01G053400v4 [Glycine max]
MNQRLEIPKNVDPRWASIIESCWHSDPACRPAFLELFQRLRDLQKKMPFSSRQPNPLQRKPTKRSSRQP